MMRILALSAAVILAGCATQQQAPEPIIKTDTVKVAIPVHCKPDIGARPSYPDSDAAVRNASNLYDRVKLIVAGRIMRTQRELELEAALKGCE